MERGQVREENSRREFTKMKEMLRGWDSFEKRVESQERREERWLEIGKESARGSKMEEIARKLMSKIENMRVEREAKDRGEGRMGWTRKYESWTNRWKVLRRGGKRIL